MQSVSINALNAPSSLGWSMLSADNVWMECSQFQTNFGLAMMHQTWAMGFEMGMRWWGRNKPMSGLFEPTLHANTESGVPLPLQQQPALLPLARPAHPLLRF